MSGDLLDVRSLTSMRVVTNFEDALFVCMRLESNEEDLIAPFPFPFLHPSISKILSRTISTFPKEKLVSFLSPSLLFSSYSSLSLSAAE